uniref:Putative secreted protein n=1 Tax=Anopheles darlingi TaxID=43151 RepID=A0A2M4DRI0_ANODA
MNGVRRRGGLADAATSCHEMGFLFLATVCGHTLAENTTTTTVTRMSPDRTLPIPVVQSSSQQNLKSFASTFHRRGPGDAVDRVMASRASVFPSWSGAR